MRALGIRKDRTSAVLRKLVKGESDGRVARREEQAELMRIVLAGPDPETSGLSAYTLEDLAGLCEKRFGKRMHPWSLGRLLKRLGFSARSNPRRQLTPPRSRHFHLPTGF